MKMMSEPVALGGFKGFGGGESGLVMYSTSCMEGGFRSGDMLSGGGVSVLLYAYW